MGLLCRQLVRETNPAAVIDDRHVQRRSPYGNLAKVHEAAFTEQRGWLESRVGQEGCHRRAGEWSTDELMEINHPIAVRIIGIRLHVMNVSGQPDDIPNPSRNDRVHNHA